MTAATADRRRVLRRRIRWIVAATIGYNLVEAVVALAAGSAAGLFHEGIPNSVRATAGSVISMADSLIVAVVAPIVAIIGQSFGIGWGVAISALLYLVVIAGGMRRNIRIGSEVLEGAD